MTRAWWVNRWVRAATVAAAVAMWPLACSQERIADKPADPNAPVAKLDYTLKDPSGRDVKLADFKGKPLVINFWATWCGPCKLEIPELIDLAAKYKSQGLTVVGISIDDAPEDLVKFVAENHMTYPVLVGSGHDDMLDNFEATFAVPITWFVRADGTIAGKHSGIATTDEFEKQIKALF
jgi:peroxiredoxin